MKKNLRCMTACLLAGIMALSMTACGSKSDKKAEEAAEESTAEVIQEEKKNTVAAGVQVPENFESMMMPMEALAMESYHLGYPYYIQFSEGSSRDSFWYSTALTAYYLHSDATERISLSEEECDMIVSALYASYQQGNLEIPEIRNGVSYVAYDDENGGYYVSRNDTDYVPQKLSDYYLNVVSCEQNGDGYVVKANLMDASLESSLGDFEYTLVANAYPGEKNEFAYSVSYMSDGSNSNPEQGLADANSEGTEEGEQATDEDGNVITEESGEESGEGSEDGDASFEGAGEGAGEGSESEDVEEISSDRALTIAQENYGPDLQYDYQGVQKLDGYPYHVFEVSGDNARVSYVLVGTNGIDCVGGNRNEDGSWSFDQ